MKKIETFQLIINGKLDIEAIYDFEKYVDYAKHEIDISEEILTVLQQLNAEGQLINWTVVEDLNEGIKICKSFIIWHDKLLVYRKIQELYGVYKRTKIQRKDEKQPIVLKPELVLTDLRNIVKRERRKNGSSMNDSKCDVSNIELANVEMAYLWRFPYCIESYKPYTGNWLVRNTET